jgi:hypothetical protein
MTAEMILNKPALEARLLLAASSLAFAQDYGRTGNDSRPEASVEEGRFCRFANSFKKTPATPTVPIAIAAFFSGPPPKPA